MGVAQSAHTDLPEPPDSGPSVAPAVTYPLTVETLVQHSAKAHEIREVEEEEEQHESFASWRSASTTATPSRASGDSQRPSLGSFTPMSGATRPSSQWLDQRPSADTPLPSNSVGIGSVYKGSSLGISESPAGVARRSRSSELMRPSSDSRRNSGGGADPAARPSQDDGSATTSVYSVAGSGRSSFALERASVEANRASLEAFQEAFAAGPAMPARLTLPPPPTPTPPGVAGAATGAAPPPPSPALSLDQLMQAAQLPSSLREKYARLSVLPPNTPAPASTLAKLWQADMHEVKAALSVLAAKGILNMAQLPDGRVWCLLQPQQLALLQDACVDAAPQYHRLLLDAYCSSTLPRIVEEPEGHPYAPPAYSSGTAAAPAGPSPGPNEPQASNQQQQERPQYHWQPQAATGEAQQQQWQRQQGARQVPAQHELPAQRLQDIPDDGYILINMGHHLTAACRHQQLRGLLLDPEWLRRKLAVAGTTAVVADFRRYLLVHNCPDVKLVLEAFQLSAAQAVGYPRAPGLLRCLMACRLVTAPLSPALQAWLSEQRRLIYEDSRQTLLSGLPRCLVPLTPSLEQAGGLQRLALRGHTAAVTKVLLTPSGTDAVTASNDGTARVWDLDVGDCVLVLEGHSAAINDMAITSDGSLLLTASADGTARAFEMERGQCLRVLAGHNAGINGLAMDPWARFVVTASTDGTARLWDLSSARSVHIIKTGSQPEQGGVLAVALSPCTRFAILGCGNNTARMYDVISGQCMGVMGGHTGWIHLVRFLPDGNRAVTASHDGTARLWDLHTGSCRHEFQGHTGRINSLVVSADGKWCATGSEDCTARIWDLKDGSCRRVLTGHKSWVSDVAISPSQDKLITTSGDGTALAYNLESGDLLCLLEGHSGPVTAAVMTRKGRFAVTVSEDTSVRVWDFAARLVQPPSYHDGRVYCVGGSTAGRVLATCGEDCDARLWDAERNTYRGLLHHHKVPIRWVAFSVDGRQLVTASPDRSVLLWDVATLALVRSVPVTEGSRIRSFAASSDLSRAVVCKWDSTVTVLDLQTGETLSTLQKWGMRDSATGHTSAVNQVLMTPDGLSVVTVSKDCTARVWDAATGTCLHVLMGHTDSVLGGAISPAADLLATFSFDDCLRLWALDSGQCLNAVRLPDTAQHVALSPDGWKVAVALSNAAVCVFDVEDRHAGRPWEFHTGEITGLQFTADGSELISCSVDGTVCVWDASTGAQTGLFVGDCGFTCCWYDGGLEQLAVGTDRGIVHSLDLGLQPRSMPAVAFASAIQLPEQAVAADDQELAVAEAMTQADGQQDGSGNLATAAAGDVAGAEGSEGEDAVQPPQHAQQAQHRKGRSPSPHSVAQVKLLPPPPPAGLRTSSSQELQAPSSPAEKEVGTSTAARRSRASSPPE